MAFTAQLGEGTGIHAADGTTTGTQCAQPATAEFIDQNFAKNTPGRISGTQY